MRPETALEPRQTRRYTRRANGEDESITIEILYMVASYVALHPMMLSAFSSH